MLTLLYAVFYMRLAHKVDAGGKPAPKQTISVRSSANSEAEELYLKGRYYWNKRTPESLNLAVDAFTQAIARDPNDAEAYVGLADCYNLLREFSVMPPNGAYLKAFSAAKKAVELNPQSADAHASLAFVTFWGMWDARDAEQEFRRALELDPNNSKAHHWFATFLQAINRESDAIVQIEAAQKLDPQSSSILADKGRILWAAGRHDEALQLLKQTEEAEPEFSSPHRYLRMAYFETHDYPRYLAEWKKEAQVRRDAVQLAAEEAAVRGYSQAGERGLLEAELSYQTKLYRQGKSSPYPMAQAEAVLGNRSEALKYLSLYLQSHGELSLSIAPDPSLARLHDVPSYKRLLSMIGIPQS